MACSGPSLSPYLLALLSRLPLHGNLDAFGKDGRALKGKGPE